MRFAHLLLASSLLLGAVASPREAAAATEPKISIAVAPFTATYLPDYTGPAMTGAVTDALVRAGKFNVVARANLDKVLAEQRLNNSDLVDPRSAQNVGRLLGAKYVVAGSLISLRWQPGFFSKDVYETKIQIQLVDTETGSIKISDTFTGTETRLGMARDFGTTNITQAEATKCFEKNLASISQQFVDRVNQLSPLEGFIASIDGPRVAINLGESAGAKVGQEYLVLVEGNAIKDPVTGETLSVQTTKVARLLVTSVEAKLAWTTIVATYSPKADVQVAGETMDAFPVDGLLQPAMLVKLTDSKAPIIQKEIEKARKKRKG